MQIKEDKGAPSGVTGKLYVVIVLLASLSIKCSVAVPSIMYFDRENPPADLIIEKLHLNKTVSTLNPKNLSVISYINVAHFYKITTKAFLE